MPTQLDEHSDALMIGSGAVGSIAMKELTEPGLEVLLFEAGRATTRTCDGATWGSRR